MANSLLSSRQYPPTHAPKYVFPLALASVRSQIPKKGISEYGTAQVKLDPLLESSELIKVEYELPFGLNAEPKDGRVVVTKAGPGGEQEGDLLRREIARLVARGAPSFLFQRVLFERVPPGVQILQRLEAGTGWVQPAGAGRRRQGYEP